MRKLEFMNHIDEVLLKKIIYEGFVKDICKMIYITYGV